MKVLIVGAGIAGLSLGFELLNQGAEVTLLEAHDVAHGASGAATSYMEPRLGTTAIRAVEWEALKRWPEFAGAIEQASGCDAGFREEGQVRVAIENTLSWFEKDLSQRKEQGWELERLDPQQVSEMEPAVCRVVVAGLFLPQVRWVDGRKICSALAAAIVAGGGTIRTGFQVTGVTATSAGVELNSACGDFVCGDALVLCTGTGNAFPGAPQDMPVVRPVRGVNLVVGMIGLARPLRHIVKHHRGNLCPRGDDRLIVGTTYDPGETALDASAAVIDKLYRNAEPILPGIRELPLVDVWCGLRPKVGDGQLFVGRSSHQSNMYFSMGHACAGYLRAPVVAQDLAELILGTGDGGLLKPLVAG